MAAMKRVLDIKMTLGLVVDMSATDRTGTVEVETGKAIGMVALQMKVMAPGMSCNVIAVKMVAWIEMLVIAGKIEIVNRVEIMRTKELLL